MDRRGNPPSAELVLTCDDLDASLAFYVGELDFRLDMIMPADAPRVAIVSGYGISLRLTQRSATTDSVFGGAGEVVIERADGPTSDTAMPVIDTPIIKRADGDNEWSAGRAGMAYRDLIPHRVGGHVIASQIRIEQGGPVDDYVHYHKVGLQLIYCRRGWVRVVYEDQGEPFVMQPGDCVLQPPTIRHRVLESSAGLEVIELGIPAEHETWRDHEMCLPTSMIDPQREFGGQRFVRHIATEASWQAGEFDGVRIRDIGITTATNGMASARVVRLDGCSGQAASILLAPAAFRFLFVLDGAVELEGFDRAPTTLANDDACVVAAKKPFSLRASSKVELLEVCVRAPWASVPAQSKAFR